MYDVQNVLEMIRRYFSGTYWIILFAVALIWLFLRGNKRQKAAMIAATILFVLLVNDYTFRFVEVKLGERARFYRHLWMIPWFLVVGLAGVDMFRRLKHPAFRVLLIGLFCGLLFYASQHEYSAIPAMIRSGTDPKLVWADTIILGDKLGELELERGKHLFVTCPDELTDQLQLYNGKIYADGSAAVEEGEMSGYAALSSEEPDVAYIMSACCEAGIDYVINVQTDSSREAYRKAGYEAILETGYYALYACEGYEGFYQDCNKYGQIVWRTWHDADGNSANHRDGYRTIRMEYDEKGLKQSETYEDADGNPIMIKGWAEARYEYDQKRRMVYTRYYDENGQPIRQKQNYAGFFREYNDWGEIARDIYLDEMDNPVILTEGYASISWEYNEQHRVIRESYLDTTGKPILLPGGYAAFERTLDEAGNVLRQCYLDSEDHLTMQENGFAEIRRTFDNQYRCINESYYDQEGNPVNNSNGIAQIRWEYNEDGTTKITKLDQDGNEVE